jgi:hypothetical protein
MNFNQKAEKQFFKLLIEIILMFSWKEACQPNNNNFNRNEVVTVTNPKWILDKYYLQN